MSGTAAVDAATQQALLQLAHGYARAMDHNEPQLLLSVMAEDAVLEGPGFRISGHEELGAVPGMLKERYRQTRHLVHQMSAKLDGGCARAETYAEASHLYDDVAAGTVALVWHLRYIDEFVQRDGRWLFAHRRLIIDWTETRPVTLPAT